MLLALACTRPPVARPDRLWGSDRPRQLAGAAVDVLPGDVAPILVSAPNDPDPYNDDADRRGTGVAFRLAPGARPGLLREVAATTYSGPGGEVTTWATEAFFTPAFSGDDRVEVVLAGPRDHYGDGVRASVFDASTSGQLSTHDARSTLRLGSGAFDPSSLVPCGDLDSDGGIDLCLRRGQAQGWALWQGPIADEDTPDRAVPISGLPFGNPWDLTSVDFDEDGSPEIVATGAEPTGLVVGSALADLATAPLIATSGVGGISSGDLDGDDRPDVVCGAVFVGSAVDELDLWWRLDDADQYASAVGDFDGDGQDDLVQAVSHDGRYKAYVFRGPLPRGVATSADADVVIEAHDGPDGWPGLTFAAGDVDGDGRDDLVVGEPGDEESFAGGSVSLYLGRSLVP
jgi:hypothetical protein